MRCDSCRCSASEAGRRGGREPGPRGKTHAERSGQELREAHEARPKLDDPRLPAIHRSFRSARLVLLGEATRSTSEFYRVRGAITRRLIEKHQFTIVAVEADWPDAAAIDRRNKAPTGMTERAFHRFPWI